MKRWRITETAAYELHATDQEQAEAKFLGSDDVNHDPEIDFVQVSERTIEEA